MTNHVHLLLRTGTVPIASIMRMLLTGYVVRFNSGHRRHGHLFQNRYKSILCEEGRYLMQLVAYIHLNPVRAGIVKDAAALRVFPIATRGLSISGSEVARQLHVDRSAVSRAVQRAGNDPDLIATAKEILGLLGLEASQH
jgi:putative transposase